MSKTQASARRRIRASWVFQIREMNQDQWNQKKPVVQAAPAERVGSASGRAAGRRIVPPAREAIAALKRAAAADRSSDLSWNHWQP